jgi:hypothetical protein
MYVKLTGVGYKGNKLGSIIKISKEAGKFLIKSGVAVEVKEKEGK